MIGHHTDPVRVSSILDVVKVNLAYAVLVLDKERRRVIPPAVPESSQQGQQWGRNEEP